MPTVLPLLTPPHSDDIARLGNPQWSWDTLTPYFTSLTSTVAPSTPAQEAHCARMDPALHGDKGPIDVSHGLWYSDLHKPWYEMQRRSGMEDAHDGPGAGDPYGLWNTLVTVDPATKTRVHAGTAFYGPAAKNKPNVKILTEAHVLRIEWDDARPHAHNDGLRANGVRFVVQGEEHVVKVQKEVIVCAGAYQSPQVVCSKSACVHT